MPTQEQQTLPIPSPQIEEFPLQDGSATGIIMYIEILDSIIYTDTVVFSIRMMYFKFSSGIAVRYEGGVASEGNLVGVYSHDKYIITLRNIREDYNFFR